MDIIFLSGKAGSGKDLAADYLSTKHGYKIMRIAAPIKKITSIITKSPLEDCYKSKSKIPYKEIGLDLGEYQQKIGTLFREHIHKDIWLKCLWRDYLDSNTKKIVIVDGRFKNEYNFFKKKAKMIRLNRLFELREKSLGNRDPFHPSEIDLDEEEFDLVIENNSMEKKTLYKEIDSYMNKGYEIKVDVKLMKIDPIIITQEDYDEYEEELKRDKEARDGYEMALEAKVVRNFSLSKYVNRLSPIDNFFNLPNFISVSRPSIFVILFPQRFNSFIFISVSRPSIFLIWFSERSNLFKFVSDSSPSIFVI